MAQGDALMRELLTLVVKVTVELQRNLSAMYVQTAKRCHYVFDMRELGVIFRNLCFSLRPHCARKDLLLLWEHECLWTYGYRMISEVDYDRYQAAFVNVVKKNFSTPEYVSTSLFLLCFH